MIDVRKELSEAAQRGIQEYLRSTSGAQVCGAGAEIEQLKNSAFVVRCANSDKDNVSFDISIY
jgi:hypothetical protein